MRRMWMSVVVALLACTGVAPAVMSQEDDRGFRPDRDRPEERDREREQDRPGERERRGDREQKRSDRPDREAFEIDIEKVKAFVKEMDPRQYEALQEMHRRMESRDLGPDQRDELARRLHDMLRGAAQMMRQLEELKKHNPAEYERLLKQQKLERESMDLAEKMRKAESGTDKGAIKDKLKGVLSELFDLREANRAREVEMLEKRLKELKETLEKRKQSRDQIIERRMNEMMGKEDSMGW